MRYYVKSYPNPRAEDGETSGYWQTRSQVFGRPIKNPSGKADMDGDGLTEEEEQVQALQQIDANKVSQLEALGGVAKQGVTNTITGISIEGKKPVTKQNNTITGISIEGKKPDPVSPNNQFGTIGKGERNPLTTKPQFPTTRQPNSEESSKNTTKGLKF